jgi:hypothetical protein
VCQVKGNLQYYFQLIYNILQKSVYTKIIDLPEVLLEQMKERELQSNNSSEDSRESPLVRLNLILQRNYDVGSNFSLIPYFDANEELLFSLNKVIRNAQKIERDSLTQVRDIEAALKGNKEYIYRLEKELRNIKEHANNNTFSRFILLTEECASLTKENNIHLYKIATFEKLIKELETQKATQAQEISILRHDLKITKLELEQVRKQ